MDDEKAVVSLAQRGLIRSDCLDPLSVECFHPVEQHLIFREPRLSECRHVFLSLYRFTYPTGTSRQSQ